MNFLSGDSDDDDELFWLTFEIWGAWFLTGVIAPSSHNFKFRLSLKYLIFLNRINTSNNKIICC